MKVCLVSYDFWGYDAHIAEELRRRGVETTQLNMSKFRHKNVAARTKNALSKIFLGINLKNGKRKEFIYDTLKSIGIQDQILTINPELFDRDTHEEIKQYTKKYIAYLYDSVSRNPVHHLLDLFDEVYSFDREDCKNYGFREITNYNYLSQAHCKEKPLYDAIFLASLDDRILFLEKLTENFLKLGIHAKYYIIGKKTLRRQIEKLAHRTPFAKKTVYTARKIKHAEIPAFYCKSKAIIDLVREGQQGLSFRFFEAMALRRKVVTNNTNVLNYDFYNPDNILVLKNADDKIDPNFFKTDYQELPEEIYEKYAVQQWVSTVFHLH